MEVSYKPRNTALEVSSRRWDKGKEPVLSELPEGVNSANPLILEFWSFEL
jgi:hypothetical protein